MSRINNILDSLLFFLVAAALTVLVGICFSQVVARYVFNAAFTWADEVSIIIMVWTTWGAACLAVKQGSHLRVRILEERISERTGLIIRLVFQSLAIPFLAAIAWISRVVLGAMENQTLMSLPSVPLNIMYLSVPVGCSLMIYYFLRSFAGDWKTLRTQTKGDK